LVRLACELRTRRVRILSNTLVFVQNVADGGASIALSSKRISRWEILSGKVRILSNISFDSI
jgi:hypothetical protein